MTWSIVARDPATGHLGVAVASFAFAVGGRVPFAAAGVGAIATQAFVNPFYGLRGLDLLRAGVPAADVLRFLTAADGGRNQRQVHLVDAAGRFAAHTGAACSRWSGHLVADGFSVAGNALAGPAVLEAMRSAFAGRPDLPLPGRLLAALLAGEEAGGDRRGGRSAALLVHDGEEYPLLDLRVDDHADPVAELARIEALSRAHFLHFRKVMPSRAEPDGVTDREEVERRIAASKAAARAP